MPIVMSYDDPALVATLATGASRYATSQDEQQMALRLAQSSRGRGGSVRTNWRDEPPGSAAPGPEPMVQVEQTDSAGRRFYSTLPASQAAAIQGGGKQQGYMLPQQRRLMDYVDQLEGGGHVDPAEAIRMRALITAGENPFARPTVGEQVKARGSGARDELTPYQARQIELREAGMESQATRETERTRRQILRDEIDDLKDLYKSTSIADSEGRAQILRQIEQKQAQLRDGSSQPAAPAPQAAPVIAPSVQQTAMESPSISFGAGGATPTAPATGAVGSAQIAPGRQPAAAAPQPSRIVRLPDGSVAQIGPDGRVVSRLTPDAPGQASRRPTMASVGPAGETIQSTPDGGIAIVDVQGQPLRQLTAQQVRELVQRHGSAAAARQAALRGEI